MIKKYLKEQYRVPFFYTGMLLLLLLVAFGLRCLCFLLKGPPALTGDRMTGAGWSEARAWIMAVGSPYGGCW